MGQKADAVNSRADEVANTTSPIMRNVTTSLPGIQDGPVPSTVSVTTNGVPGAVSTTPAGTADSSKEGYVADSPAYCEKDVQPVGQDYIEEIRNEEGTLTIL